jgi:peptide-methionine (R)-S-oxide reductase
MIGRKGYAMNRRSFLGLAGAAAVASGIFSRKAQAMTDGKVEKLEKSKKEWKAILDASAYSVLFEEATERPFTSTLLEEKRKGKYICAACFLPLFESEAKYESGTGWPSFFQAIEGRLGTKTDFKLILPRTEYHCARCGGHQGHVFDDGPRPTGKRFCNNGVALAFVAEGEPLPELRS